jgi:hypothetical protein
MLSIAEIREQYPDTKDLSDSEILFRVSKLTELPVEQVAQDFGINDPRKAPKGALGGINDFMINTANAAVGGIKAGVDFVAPGSDVSKGLQSFIESGEQKLSLQERLSQQRLGEGLQSSEFGTQAGAVFERLKDAPLQTVGQAIGSFAIPGTAIKGARGAAGVLGVGERAVQKATQFGPINRQIAQEVTNKALSPYGTTAAMSTGALLAGGDAAGDAFDRVFEATGDRELAVQAAREASIAPAFVGAATSLIGADKALARGGNRSILKTTGGEFAGEFIDEATTKASANIATSQYVPDTDIFAGVFGSGLMGGIQGAGIGAGVGLMSRQRTMLAGSNETGGLGGLQSDGSGIGKAININDSEVNTKTAIPPRGPITVTAGGEALVTPEQQQAYDQFGRNQVGPFPPASQQQQSGQVAAANVQAQAQQQQQQAAIVKEQEAAAVQQQFSELATVYGLSGGQPGTPFKLAGKNLFTQGDAETFLRAVDKLNEGRTLEQKQAFGAVISSGAVKIKPDATPKAVVNSINSFMDKWGLGSAENTTDLAERVNADIAGIEGSNAVNLAGPLNDLYRTITGQDSPAFGTLLAAAEAPAAKVGKKGKEAPAAQQPSKVTPGSADAVAEAQARIDAEEASKTTGAVNDGQLPMQDDAGLRNVRVQGGATETTQGELGIVQPQSVQSVQSGSVVGGQNRIEDDTAGDGGVRAGTSELTAGRDADVSRDELTEAQTKVRELLVASFGERDTNIIYDVLMNDLSGPQIAKKYGISQQRVDQIAGPKAQKTWGPRIEKGAARLGMTIDQVEAIFTPFEAQKTAADTENLVDDQADIVEGRSAPEAVTRTLSDEADKNAAEFADGLGREDLFDNDETGTTAGFGVIGSVGGSQSETETGNDLTQQWMDAIEKGDTEEAARIQAQIEGKKTPSGSEKKPKAAKKPKVEAKAEEIKAPVGFRYSITESPAYEGTDPLSTEDADFELSVLLDRAKKGKLTPEIFAQSEIGKRLDTSQVMLINANLRTDPVATIESLIEAVQPPKKTKTKAKAEEVKTTQEQQIKEAESIGRVNGISAKDQIQEYESVDEAIMSFEQNYFDTMSDLGVKDPVVIEAGHKAFLKQVESLRKRLPSDEWAALAKQYAGMPSWDSLTTEQQDRVTDMVQRGVFNLAAANKIASEKPAAKTTDKQKADAELVAKGLGGVVAWQEGPVALVRGHSMLSGQPVYQVAVGTKYSILDVDEYTGNLITPEQKANLSEQKKRLEAEAAQKHKDDPFITFSRDGIAVSKNVPAALVGVATGWKKILGLDANIYITTIEDARADIDNFTGPHRAVSSSALDAREKGSMRRMPDGSYYIAFTKSTSQTQMLEILAHEMGHIHERESFKNAPKETQEAIIAEHKKWVESQKGKTGAELVKALRARSTGRATSKDAAAKAEDMDRYWTSFSEWYADQVSRWAVTSEKPMTVVEKFFSRLAAAMKKFYYSLKGQQYLPTETMKKFLDNASENLTTQELAGDTKNFESSSMFVGTKALQRSGNPDNMANLVTAKIMETNGVAPEDIWTDTGWYRGADGKWRFELDDTKAKFKFPKVASQTDTLKDFMDHPELFSLYPELKNITVQWNPTGKDDEGAVAFLPVNGVYKVNRIMINGSSDITKSALIHEVQHIVQVIEEFGGGGLPTTFDALKFATDKNGNEVPITLGQIRNIRDLIKLPEFLADQVKFTDKYRKDVDAALQQLEKAIASNQPLPVLTVIQNKFSAEVMRGLSYIRYRLLAGEVEANNAAYRFDLGVKARRLIYPGVTADAQKDAELFAKEFPKSLKTSLASISQAAEDRIATLPKPYQGPLNTIMDTLIGAARKGLVNIAFTKDLAVLAAQKGLKSAIDYVGLMGSRQAIKTENERRVETIAQSFDKLPSNLKGTGAGSVNAFLKDSTMGNKWGFQPSWLSKPVKVDGAMQAKFGALPEDAQAVIKSVFKHGYDTLMEMKKSVMENINTEYDALIADAQMNGDAKEVADLQKQKSDSLKNYQTLMAVNANSPYAPLKRFGNYVVVGRSAAYIDAEKTATDNNATPEERKAARKELEKMQTNEKHYFVQFAETNAEAKAIARENKGAYPGGVVQNFEKEQVRDSLYGGRDIQGVFYRLRNLINESQDDKKIADVSKRALNRLVNDLHLSLLSEHSARQSERRRKGIAGADDDMMRAFVTQGRATAHFLSTLHNTGAIYDSLQAMKKEAAGLEEGRDVRSQYYNEMLKRHAMTLEYQVSPFVDKAMSATSTWMLLTNPAYYLQNLTQPMMMSLPVVAAKHGYTKSASAMLNAYKELTSVLTKNGLNEDTYSKLPTDVRNAIESLVNSGHIDISLSQDLGRWRSSGDQNIAAKTLDKIRSISEDVESINRVVTAVAAYRLDKASGATEAQATKYAGKVVYDTHGDYSGFNAPRFSRQGIGRLATQFRKFQLIQISLIAKLGNQAFKGASAEERAIGKKALAYTLTHTFAVSGVMGLPGFTAIAWILGKVFGDSDEPDNPEATLRKMIGDDALADLLLKGVPKLAGVDLSGKLGMGQMLSILPYTNIDMSRDGYARAVTAAMGPFVGGIMPKVVDGIAQMSDGNYYKGIEAMAPSGINQAMKGYRMGTEGITKRNGEVILAPEDITFFDAFMQGIGLPTNTITDRQYINRTEIEYERFYSERTSDIKRDYINAYKKGDSEGMEEARMKWMEMQDSRRANGFKVQPMSDLFRAPRNAAKREVKTVRSLDTSGATAAGFQLR